MFLSAGLRTNVPEAGSWTCTVTRTINQQQLGISTIFIFGPNYKVQSPPYSLSLTSPPRKVASLLHVQHGADAVALLHDLEGVIDLGQRLAVRDELVDLEAPVEIVGHEAGQLGAALNAAERAALPDAARDELEC